MRGRGSGSGVQCSACIGGVAAGRALVSRPRPAGPAPTHAALLAVSQSRADPTHGHGLHGHTPPPARPPRRAGTPDLSWIGGQAGDLYERDCWLVSGEPSSPTPRTETEEGKGRRARRQYGSLVGKAGGLEP